MIHDQIAQYGVANAVHAAGAAYPISVATLSFWGIPLQGWVQITAIAAALATIGYSIFRGVLDWRAAKVAKRAIRPSVPKPGA